MNTQLKKGMGVQLLPAEQLLEIFNQRKFFSEDFRETAAQTLGSAKGIIDNIEEKYAYDYFFFQPDENSTNWSIPYEAIEYVKLTAIEESTRRIYNKYIGTQNYGELMTVDEWKVAVESRSFKVTNLITTDGCGYWVKNNMESTDEVFSTEQQDATHVIWYNK